MSNAGAYLYGFTDARFTPAPDLSGLAGVAVRRIVFRDVAAIVSTHPVRHLMPSRSNVEPHHRVVRQVSAQTTMIPAAFGHISETDAQILGVLESSRDDIRGELVRLADRCEMTVRLRWTVENIFDHLVRSNRDLRELRDRVFRDPQPPLNAKLQVGSMFETTIARERERLTNVLLGALQGVTCESTVTTPRDERTVCRAALLIDRARAVDFARALEPAAALLKSDFTLDYSGPWPPYSFVRLRLHSTPRSTAA